MKRLRGIADWLDRHRIFLMSLAVMAFSSAFDGRFVASLMWPTPLGLIFGYGLNAAIDFASEEFAYWYAFFQRTAAKGSKQKKLSGWLLLGEAMMIYYSVVFSFAAIAESRPDVGLWLQWSGASWAPAALLWLGIARALRDVKMETTKQTATITESVEPIAESPPEPRVFAGGIAAWREMATKLDGHATNLTARGVNEFLEAHGFEPVAESTARYWAADAHRRANGHKVREEA